MNRRPTAVLRALGRSSVAMHALRRHIADGVAVLVPGGPAEFASRIGTPFGAARMVAETARPKIA